MSRVKVSEATGPVLDWMVAKALGISPFSDGISWIVYSHNSKSFRQLPKYSTDWSQGGPIIEQEKISVIPFDERWEARCACTVNRSVARFIERRGPTPLIAAMRCFVSSKLGDEVETPKGFNHA